MQRGLTIYRSEGLRLDKVVSPRSLTLVAILFAVAFRSFLIFSHSGFLGVDVHAYLNHALDLMGRDIYNADFVRPPLAPGYLLVPFVWAFGTVQGSNLFALIGSLLPIFAFALFAKRYLTQWQLAACIVFLTVELNAAEMIVTGVLPMLGFSELFVLLWAIRQIAQRDYHPMAGNEALWCLIASLIPLIAFTNQTTTGISMLVVPLYVLLLRLEHKDTFRRVRTPIAVGVLAALSALPWYGGVAFGGQSVRFGGPLLTFDYAISAWFTGMICFMIGGLGLLLEKKIRIPAVLAMVLGVLHLFASYDESIMNIFYRSGYLAPFFAYLVAAVVITNLLTNYLKPVLCAALFGALFVLSAVCYQFVFQGQTVYSDMITPATERAIAHIEDREATLVTNSRLMSIGFGGLYNIKSIWTTSAPPPEAFKEGQEQSNCILGFSACDPIGLAHSLNIRYVLIDRRFQDDQKQTIYGAPKENPWDVPANAPWLTEVYREGSVRLYVVS